MFGRATAEIDTQCDWSSDFSSNFLNRLVLDLNRTEWTYKSKVERKVWKLIENLMWVRFSIDILVRTVTSQWRFPIQISNRFINWNSIVKSYRVTITTIDLPKLVDWKSGEKSQHVVTSLLYKDFITYRCVSFK